jgi:hypothetical protein
MLYKEDWEIAKKRLMAWWERELLDRTVIQVTAPRPGERKTLPPKDLKQRWMDIDYILDAAEERMRMTYYGGEAFPAYNHNLGPDIFACFLGCDIIFGEHTSWSVPIIKEWGDLDKVRFDKRRHWWRLAQKMIEEGCKRFQGKAALGLTDIHGGGDGVAALRDPQALAADLIDHPEEVKKAMKLVEKAWFEVFEGERELLRRYTEGMTCWLSLWHPGKWYPVSIDFICMVSPAMFREFFLDELVAEINYLDRSIYHLDGPKAAKLHLDTLLSIQKLDAIQWVPGANSGPIAQWFPMLKKIQAAGKGLQVYIESWELESVMENLSPKGLCIVTSTNSVAEADALIKKTAKMTRAHR